MRDLDIVSAMTLSATEIALDIWNNRFDLKVGMVSLTAREFTVEVHRLTETDFLLVLSDIPWKEKHAILDKIYGRA